jgi:hypothetical protein
MRELTADELLIPAGGFMVGDDDWCEFDCSGRVGGAGADYTRSSSDVQALYGNAGYGDGRTSALQLTTQEALSCAGAVGGMGIAAANPAALVIASTSAYSAIITVGNYINSLSPTTPKRSFFGSARGI